jgi:hypothetical protein
MVATRYSAGAAASARGAVKWLGICFLFLFSGFQAAQGLQSSLNTELGLINLAVLYTVFAASLLEAPRMVAALERRFDGLPWVLALGGSSFVLAIAVNLVQPSVEPSWKWGVYVGSFAILGVGAAALWTAQAEYLGRSAVSATRRSGLVSSATTELNALFFSFFQFSGFVGCGITAFIFSGSASRERLFVLLSIVASIGAAAFLGLPRQDFVTLGSPAPRVHGGVKEVFVISMSPEFVRLLLLIFTNGLMLGFFSGPFMETVVTAAVGPQWVGHILMTFFAVNAVSTRLWGYLRTRLPGNGSLVLATLVVGGVFVWLLVDIFPTNFVLDEQTGEWVQVVNSVDLKTTMIKLGSLVSIFAMGDAYFESQLPATIQGEFQTSGNSLEANAAYKFWQTLGTATQLILALAIEVDKQLVVLISFLLLGLWSSRYRGLSPSLSTGHERLMEEEEEPSIQV